MKTATLSSLPLLLLCSLASLANTQTDTPALSPTSSPTETTETGVELTPLPTIVDTPTPVPLPALAASDTLSVDFPEEDVRNILRNVADLFELNIVVPDALQGRTSLKLRDVTWRQIFRVVLDPLGYTFVEEGNIIKIVTRESLAQEPLTTEVFILNYARAEEILPTISSLINSTGGSAKVDKRSNALIIFERPTVIAKIGPVIERLDKATEQVMIETKFIEVNADTQRDIGLNWVAAGGLTTGAEGQAVSTGKKTAPGYTTSNGTFIPAGLSYSTAVLSNIEFVNTLRLIQSKGDSKIVSNPTVVTLNNTEAFINVGEEYPIPSYTYNAERGAFEVSGFEYKPIGIILKVTPQINNQGFVRLAVEPEISSSTRSAQFGGTATSPAADIPIIETRKTKTQVSLKDGHTLGIGGLISETNRNKEDRLPFFGDIPGIGKLFTSKGKEASRRNLLIFITAKIVSAESAKPEEIFDARQIRDADIRRSELPGFRPSGVEAFKAE